MYIICINTNVEEEMKNKKEFYAMQFEKLGFKKVPTEDGFVMYELNPAALRKSQDTSSKPQAATICRIYIKRNQDNTDIWK